MCPVSMDMNRLTLGLSKEKKLYKCSRGSLLKDLIDVLI